MCPFPFKELFKKKESAAKHLRNTLSIYTTELKCIFLPTNVPFFYSRFLAEEYLNVNLPSFQDQLGSL